LKNKKKPKKSNKGINKQSLAHFVTQIVAPQNWKN
jgi:hypothetical protein